MSIFNSVIVGGGTTPTGSISITNNGTYDVTDKATAVVNVPTTAPAHYIEKTVSNGRLENSTNIINLNGVTDVGGFALAYAYTGASFPANTGLSLPFTTISGGSSCQYMFQGCTGLTSANLSSLTTVGGSYACGYMFGGCTGLTSFDLSALTTISGGSACANMFSDCWGLTSADLSALTTISGEYACSSMFWNCYGLTSFDLSALTTISVGGAQYMFYGCTGLTSANLSALTTISDYACAAMFGGCTSLATVYIGGTTAITFGSEPFSTMFEGCTQNIDVYAPAANQAEIEAMDGYPNFGGTGNVVWHWRS